MSLNLSSAVNEGLLVSPETWLDGDEDMSALADATPRTFFVKGLFFTRLLQLCGLDWSEVAGALESPPNAGRYTAFRDYPWRDYARLIGIAARACHPRVNTNEALRRLGWDDHDLFSRTTSGRITLALVGSPRQAILHTPSVYLQMAKGERRMQAKELDPLTVKLEIEPNYASWAYLVGQFQGITSHYGPCPSILVEHGNNRRLDLTFHLSG